MLFPVPSDTHVKLEQVSKSKSQVFISPAVRETLLFLKVVICELSVNIINENFWHRMKSRTNLEAHRREFLATCCRAFKPNAHVSRVYVSVGMLLQATSEKTKHKCQTGSPVQRLNRHKDELATLQLNDLLYLLFVG